MCVHACVCVCVRACACVCVHVCEVWISAGVSSPLCTSAQLSSLRMVSPRALGIILVDMFRCVVRYACACEYMCVCVHVCVHACVRVVCMHGVNRRFSDTIDYRPL